MSETVYWSYPQHIQAGGPVSFSTFVADVQDIGAAYLEYAFALTQPNFSTVVLDFLPSGYPDRVRVGCGTDLVSFVPESDEVDMRKAIIKAVGTKVRLPKLDAV